MILQPTTMLASSMLLAVHSANAHTHIYKLHSSLVMKQLWFLFLLLLPSKPNERTFRSTIARFSSSSDKCTVKVVSLASVVHVAGLHPSARIEEGASVRATIILYLYLYTTLPHTAVKREKGKRKRWRRQLKTDLFVACKVSASYTHQVVPSFSSAP